MILVGSSDWHGDQSTAGVDRFDDVSRAIDVSVQAAIDLKADAYLMCGDLTDPNTVRSHRAVAKAIAVQCRLRNHGIVPIFVAGNHDVIEDGSGMTTMSPLAATGIGHVFEKPSDVSDELSVHVDLLLTKAILDGLAEYGESNTDDVWRKIKSDNNKPRQGARLIALPFTATSHDYDPDAFIRACHKRHYDPKEPVLIIGHLNLEGISPGSETTDMPRGRNVYWPMDAIKECFPTATVIGGHYHTPQEYNGVTIIGSMVRLRFDERDNTPGYIVVEV